MTISNISSNIVAQTLGSTTKKDGELDKAAKEFEKMALTQLLNFADTDDDMSKSPFGGGQGEAAFKPMLTEQYAKKFEERGGIGIAPAVKAELIKMQAAAAKNGQ